MGTFHKISSFLEFSPEKDRVISEKILTTLYKKVQKVFICRFNFVNTCKIYYLRLSENCFIPFFSMHKIFSLRFLLVNGSNCDPFFFFFLNFHTIKIRYFYMNLVHNFHNQIILVAINIEYTLICAHPNALNETKQYKTKQQQQLFENNQINIS